MPAKCWIEVSDAYCKGCELCLARCPFGAVEMNPVPNSKKALATIIDEKCLGCGVCILGCEQNALTYEIVKPPEFIPAEPAFPVPRENLYQ